jgi:hypothetical protein
MRCDPAVVRRQVQFCQERLEEGRLTADDLRAVLGALEERPRVQDLLYLQASGTSPFSEIVGMLLVENGGKVELPHDAAEWPYRTVIDAVRDGWRIVSFPNLALLTDETRNYALGPEFILER